MNPIQKTMDFLKEKQLGETTGHDWWHSERVYQMAMMLCDDLNHVDRKVVALAALLHDIEDWKFNDGDEMAGPKAARAWLESLEVEISVIDHVTTIIYDLSYKGTEKKAAMKTLEGQIVQDADRLDALGAIGIARTFAFGAYYGNEIFNPDIPPRMVIDEAAYKDKKAKSTTVNHFYEKLFNLKELMNTEKAKKIAEKRHDFMVMYMTTFLEEAGYSEGVHNEALAKMVQE